MLWSLVRRCSLALAWVTVSLGTPNAAFAADEESEGTTESSESSKKEESTSDEGGDSDAKDEPAKDDAKKDDAFGHAGQFGVRLGLIAGYRMVLRYDDSPYCRKPDPLKAANNQPKFCGHGAPLALQAGLSYALFDFLEPYAWGRFGLADEPQTDTEPVLMFGAGVRVYTMSDSAFKIFIEPAIGLELEGGRGTQEWQANNPEYPNDFVLHLAAGPTLDFSRNVGVYLTGGVTASVIRALASSLELDLGIQGRF